MGAVLPAGTRVIAVGGVTPVNIASLKRAGAHAFGTGGDLFKPGRSATEVAHRAQLMVASINADEPEPYLLADRGTTIGEAPCIGPDGHVYWVDPLAPALHLADPASGEGGTISLTEAVWSLGWHADHLFGTLDDGFCRIDSKTGAITRLSAVDPGAGCRLNDMTIDARGGLWAGSMHRGVLAGTGALFHAVNPGAAPCRMAGGLGVANGMAFSPDGAMLYVVDTLARTLLAYPVGGARRELDEPRIVTDFMNVPGKPDGLTIAPDGSLWVAMWGGGCVQHVDASGALLERLALPAPHVGSVVLHHKSLFVTTARARLSQTSLGASPQSGGLFRIDLK
jgi:sugar lactone lactonase YvrE